MRIAPSTSRPTSPVVHNTLGTVLQALGPRRRAERSSNALRSTRAAYALNNLCYAWTLEGTPRERSSRVPAALQLSPIWSRRATTSRLAYAAAGDLEDARDARGPASRPRALQQPGHRPPRATASMPRRCKAFEAAQRARREFVPPRRSRARPANWPTEQLSMRTHVMADDARTPERPGGAACRRARHPRGSRAQPGSRHPAGAQAAALLRRADRHRDRAPPRPRVLGHRAGARRSSSACISARSSAAPASAGRPTAIASPTPAASARCCSSRTTTTSASRRCRSPNTSRI